MRITPLRCLARIRLLQQISTSDLCSDILRPNQQNSTSSGLESSSTENCLMADARIRTWCKFYSNSTSQAAEARAYQGASTAAVYQNMQRTIWTCGDYELSFSPFQFLLFKLILLISSNKGFRDALEPIAIESPCALQSPSRKEDQPVAQQIEGHSRTGDIPHQQITRSKRTKISVP
jgi:hypothetical protein